MQARMIGGSRVPPHSAVTGERRREPASMQHLLNYRQSSFSLVRNLSRVRAGGRSLAILVS
jgi:hypothetical protein